MLSIARNLIIWRLPRPAPQQLFARLALRASKARQRRALAELPDELLADIGLTRDEARREAARGFWR